MAEAPGKLSVLFRLKYLEGISDPKFLAEKLGVSLNILPKYEKELKNLLIQRINRITPERLRFICPECLRARVYRDPETGERVCMNCGYVLEDEPTPDNRLPFGTTYALESHLAVGRSLGGTLPSREISRIIERNGGGDIGSRIKAIRVAIETSEPPQLARLLQIGYELSKKHGLDHDKLFNNDLGINIRRAYRLASDLKKFGVKVTYEEVAGTAFLLTLMQYGKKEEGRTPGVKINHNLLSLLYVYYRTLATIARKTKKSNSF